MASRRIAYTYVTRELLVDLFRPRKEGQMFVGMLPSNLPEDISVEDVWYDPMIRGFVVVLASEVFEEVPEGAKPPFISGTFETTYADAPNGDLWRISRGTYKLGEI